LDGRETYGVVGIGDGLSPRQSVTVTADRDDGRQIRFEAIARLDGPIEVDYYRGGGILPAVLHRLARQT
jgi:aconitate hydratase